MKKITIENDFAYVYEHEDNPYHVDFKVFEITGHYEDKKTGEYTVPIYESKGAKSSSDTTENIEEAQTFIEGMVKWDGCSHYNFGDEGYLHICGKHNIEAISEIIKRIYFDCGEIMSENTDIEEFER